VSTDKTFGPRKLQALTLASQGLTRYKIADQMGISTKSVNSYLADCYRLLGVPGREDSMHAAIARAQQLRLIPKVKR
jgi:DNA-binding CsgD family transcriptional regulator